MQNKILFFLRHYNDIDHIVPVIYKWLKLGKGHATIVITTNPSYLDDYRIQFLRQFDELSIHYIDDFLNDVQRNQKAKSQNDDTSKQPAARQNRFARMRNFHLVQMIAKLKASFTGKLQNFFRLSTQELYDEAFIESMLDEVFGVSMNGLVVFDWFSLHAPHLNFVRHVSKVAKIRGFTSVALPHGDSPFYNLMIRMNEINYTCLQSYAGPAILDYVVVPNNLCAKRYKPHMQEERIKILGSPRYNQEWLNIHQSLLPSYESEKERGKLKIVFFLRNFTYPIYWDEVIRTIKLVTQFPEVHLVVKHHTRDVQLQQLLQSYQELNTEDAPNLDIVYDEVHSGSLLQWGDLFMDLGTSIVFEAVKLGKPVLAIEYVQAGYSTVSFYMKSCAMQCRDELFDTIQTFIRDRHYTLYKPGERENFLSKVVDVPDANVLDRYVQFLESCIADSSVSQS